MLLKSDRQPDLSSLELLAGLANRRCRLGTDSVPANGAQGLDLEYRRNPHTAKTLIPFNIV